LTSQAVDNDYDNNSGISSDTQEKPNSLTTKPRFTFSGIDMTV